MASRRRADLDHAPIALLGVTNSASTKKAAKLAQKGKGKRVRFQGGTLFPLVVAITLIVGLALIVYSRQTRPAADSSPPTVNDHWHAAYGFFLCDTWYELQGNLEQTNSQGQLTNTNFLRTGIHSHDDGVIHWHPYTSVAVGKRAKLKVFLDTYDVRLEDDRLVFPENQPVEWQSRVPASQTEWVEGETQCDGEDAELSVKAWGLFTDTDDGTTYIANMDQVHIDNNNMVFGIYFVPRGADRPMPPRAQQLPELSQVDMNNQYYPDLDQLLNLDESDLQDVDLDNLPDNVGQTGRLDLGTGGGDVTGEPAGTGDEPTTDTSGTVEESGTGG